jgi:hypothetical protein
MSVTAYKLLELARHLQFAPKPDPTKEPITVVPDHDPRRNYDKHVVGLECFDLMITHTTARSFSRITISRRYS